MVGPWDNVEQFIVSGCQLLDCHSFLGMDLLYVFWKLGINKVPMCIINVTF